MTAYPQQTLKKELASISSKNWLNSPHHDSNEPEIISWLPLFHFNSEKILGLDKNGYWVSNFGTSIIVYRPEKLVLPLFPCLEIEYNEFHNLLKAAFLRWGLSEKLIDTFPTSKLVYLALTDVSGYWTELALNWLEYIIIDDKIKEQLQQITHAKWASQKTRQKASKFLRGKITRKSH